MNEMTITERYVIPPHHHNFLIRPLPTATLLHFLPPCKLLTHSFPSYFFGTSEIMLIKIQPHATV